MYDVIVIGGGPGGYKTAELCRKQGFSVALIEEKELGGTCLNHGCIPFKTYLHISRAKQDFSNKYAIGLLHGNDLSVDLGKLLEYKDRVVAGLQQSVKGLLLSCGADVYIGTGKVVEGDENHIAVETDDNVIHGRYLVIATGSKEREMSYPQGLPYRVINSNEMLELKTLPRSIDIVGGGVIGLEAASFFSDSGSEVRIIEATDHLGGRIDSDIAETIEQIYGRKGIEVNTNTTVEEFSNQGIVYKCGGDSILSSPECLLFSIGRVPNLDNTSLDKLGITYNDNGILIDDSCKTNVDNVFACGDVTGKMMLAHVAYRQAKIITDTICGKNTKMDYHSIPRIIYSNPEVLSVGLTENECNGFEYDVRTLPMTYSGKYYAENGKDGAKAKMILERNRIVGFHMIGNGSSELSLAAEMMVSSRMDVDDVRNLVFAHPTYGEIIGELAGLF